MSITISKNMTADEIRKALEKLPKGKVLHAAKHCGVLTLREDPIQYQKRIRDEWR